MTRMIFLNVGWMERYDGLDDDQITRGGSWVDNHGYGHEIFNFRPFLGAMYGYVQVPGSINIDRLGASPRDLSINDVLAIWVATNPGGRTYIVGWYEGATVYREAQRPPSGADRMIPLDLAIDEDIGSQATYRVSAPERNCVLLPSNERIFEIPRGDQGIGRSNLWYADAPANTRFRDQVVEYVQSRCQREAQSRRKYGPGGESVDHKALKEWCARNAAALGLANVCHTPGETEHAFVSGDRADVVFEMADGHYAAIEVETADPEPGAHQALKYRTLLCAEKGLPIDSDRVEGVLVAWHVPEDVKAFCSRYGIRWFEHMIGSS